MKPFKISLVLIAILMVASPSRSQQLSVNAYYGDYRTAKKNIGSPSASLAGPIRIAWKTPKVKNRYHLGILLPHLKDSYWSAVNYGLYTRANELGVKITLYVADAYGNIGSQYLQLRHLHENIDIDAIIIASVSYKKMDPFITESIVSGVPVIGLVNDIYAPSISAKSMVSYFDMGYIVGKYLLKLEQKGNVTVAFFPGPQDSGWAPDSVRGFLSAIRHENRDRSGQISVIGPFYGDTRHKVQQMRLDLLNKKENHGVDYIIGNSVAAVTAVDYLKSHHKFHPDAKILATYITPEVYNHIKKRTILAAPSDQNIIQAQIAVDMAVNILNQTVPGKDIPFRISPDILLITTQNIDQYRYRTLFGKKNYSPVYNEFTTK